MTSDGSHTKPILVTGAAGAVGGIGRNLTELLLAKGHKVRALVRREDERAEALRQLGAEVVQGDLTDLASMHRAIEGCSAYLFRNVCFGGLPKATVNTAAVARHHGVEAFVNMSQMTVYADEHHRDHRQPAAQAALAGGAGPVMVGTAGRHDAADGLPRGLLSSTRRPGRAGRPTSWRCQWAAARPRRSRRSTWRVRYRSSSTIPRRISDKSTI